MYVFCLQVIDVCWCSFSDSNFQKSQQVLNWIQIRWLTWPLQNINNIFRQPLLRRFSCMVGWVLRHINLCMLFNAKSKLYALDHYPAGKCNQKVAQDSQQTTSNFLARSVYTFGHTFYRLLLIFYPHLSLKNIPKSLYCHCSWYRVLWWVGFAIFPPHMISIIMTKQLNFSFICP